MAIVVHVEKEIQRTKQHSVNYLLEDDSTGEVRFNPQILRGGTNEAASSKEDYEGW